MPIELFHFTLTHASVPLLNLLRLGSHSVESQVDTRGSNQSLQVVKRSEDGRDAVRLLQLAVKEAVEVNQEGIHLIG
jgi:hypothetical protein